MAKGKKTAGEPSEASDAALTSISEDLLPTGKLYYRIGEVSDITGVKTYVLRYWESEFRGMVPQKSRSKQRLYKRRDIEMIMLIKKLLYEERYTIAGARQRIKELAAARTPEAPAAPVSPIARAAGKAARIAKGDAKQSRRRTLLEQPIDHRAEYARIKQDLVSLRAML
jgi:DNA-binding transcriptional MerR regulator